MSNEEVEVALPGGLGSGGLVVRVGDTLRRPVVAQTQAVEAFLTHLAASGFDGAPRPLGRDAKGRSILTWMPGEVAMPPFPAWVADDEAIASVAQLQRRLHDASRSYTPPAGAQWYTPNLPPAGPDAIVGHNDLCVENVVFVNGRASAFIDFDFAAPSDPLLDVSIACRHWVPFKDPSDLTDGFAGVDQARRFAIYCDAYGLAVEQRATVIQHGLNFLDRALETIRSLVQAGLPLYVAIWDSGYEKQNRRSHDWLRRFGETLAR